MTGSARSVSLESVSDAIPAPLADDDDDVSWALKTAAVQWNRGQLADALQWLGRAVDSALESGNTDRAAELQRAASQLEKRTSSSSSPSEIPAPSARAILDSIHETLQEAASQGLMPEPVAGSDPLTPLPEGTQGPKRPLGEDEP
jgi:hypothetical protein